MNKGFGYRLSLNSLDLEYNVAFVSKKKEAFENYERWIKLFKEARKRGEM